MKNVRDRSVLARTVGIAALLGNLLLFLVPSTATAAPEIASKPAGELTTQWWRTFLALPEKRKASQSL